MFPDQHQEPLILVKRVRAYSGARRRAPANSVSRPTCRPAPPRRYRLHTGTMTSRAQLDADFQRTIKKRLLTAQGGSRRSPFLVKDRRPTNLGAYERPAMTANAAKHSASANSIRHRHG